MPVNATDTNTRDNEMLICDLPSWGNEAKLLLREIGRDVTSKQAREGAGMLDGNGGERACKKRRCLTHDGTFT